MRPAQQCRVTCVGQDVDAALGTVEPAIDIVEQYLARAGRKALEVARPLRPLRHCRRADQCVLAIGGHDRRARASAHGGVAAPAAVLVDKPRPHPGIAARRRCSRAEQQFHLPARSHAQQSEAQPPAERPEPAVMLAALAAGRHGGGEPNLVAGTGAVHRLQHQFEIELHLQFADDQHRRLALAKADHIAIPDFAFDDEIEVLEEFLYRRIERHFGHVEGIAEFDAVRHVGQPIALPRRWRRSRGVFRDARRVRRARARPRHGSRCRRP